MSTFEVVWAADIGEVFDVANGKPEPVPAGSVAWRAWRSHNFTGALVERGGSAPHRWVRLQFEQTPETTVSYTITEQFGDAFYSPALSPAALAVHEQQLLDAIDARAESIVRPIDALLLYAKWQEVRDVNAIGLAAALALPTGARAARFPFIVATLAERPELSPAEVLDYFTATTQAKIAKAARLEARRDNLKRQILEATTQAAKEAAAAGDWGGV